MLVGLKVLLNIKIPNTCCTHGYTTEPKNTVISPINTIFFPESSRSQ